MDWHRGGYLYVAYESGDVGAYGDQGHVIGTFHLQLQPGFLPAEIVSAKVHAVELIIISGFKGREGKIFIWESTSGRLIESFATPELAAGMDIDPGTTAPKHAHVLYVASPITSSVYFIDLDSADPRPNALMSIRGARSLGPVVFDQSRDRLFIGDQGSGELYEVDCATGRYSTVASDLGTPVSLALDGTSGVLYVADSFSGTIHTFRVGQSDGKVSRSVSMPTGLQSIQAIALAPDNSLYVASRSSVYRFWPKTRLKSLVINAPPNPRTNLTVVVK